jgi:hypothetical protein
MGNKITTEHTQIDKNDNDNRHLHERDPKATHADPCRDTSHSPNKGRRKCLRASSTEIF